MKDVHISSKVKRRSEKKEYDIYHFGNIRSSILKFFILNKALADGEVEVVLDFLKDKSKDELSQ